MNSFYILNALAIIFLTKNIIDKLKFIIIIFLSLLLLSGHFLSTDISQYYLKAPFELLLFFGLALFEIINKRSKNASFIILLSYSYLLHTEEYLFLGQSLIYIVSTLYHKEERLKDKVSLLFFLIMWPASIAVHNIIPDTQFRIFFPLMMSYLLLFRVLGTRTISNATVFAIALTQIPFLGLAKDLIINNEVLTIIFTLLSVVIILQRKVTDLFYPLLVIIPSVLRPDTALEIISILFSLKLFGEKEIKGKYISSELTKLDILQIITLMGAIVIALLHFNNIALIAFMFLTYTLSQSNTAFRFLLLKENSFLHITSFFLIGLLGLYTVLI